VLDVNGDFAEKRCNHGSVDLEPVVEAEDLELLRGLITRHAELTGSKQATKILQNWEELLRRFVKVFPREYKRVLGVSRASDATVIPQPAALHTAAGQVQHG
jgi:glutamate synthase domain-containing protein 3